MGWISSVQRALFGSKAAGLTASSPELVNNMAVSVGSPNGLPRRSMAELLKAPGSMPWLNAITRKVGGAVGSASWSMYATRNARGKFYRNHALQKSQGEERRKLAARLRDGGELVEITDHPLLALLHRFNPRISGRAGFELGQAWIDLVGDAFLIKERNGAGMTVELWPAPPTSILSLPTIAAPWFRVAFGGMNADVPISEMIWISQINPADPYGRGVGTASALADELDADEFAAKRIKAFFYNGAIPDALVSVKGAGKPALEEAKARWEGQHRGFLNAFRTHFTGAELTVHRLDTSFKDSQLVELRKFERDTIVQVYGLPPEKLGIVENSNRANIEAADLFFAKDVVRPRLELWRGELQTSLVDEVDDRLILEFSDPVPEDREFKLKVFTSAPRDFSRNERRRLAGELPAEDGDELVEESIAPAPAAPGIPADPKWAKALNVWQAPVEPSDPEGIQARAKDPQRIQAGPKDPHRIKSSAAMLAAIEALRPEPMAYELADEMKERISGWSKAALDALGQGARFELLNPWITRYVDDFAGRKIADMTETTRDDLREALSDGIRAGESIDDLAKRVGAVFDYADEVRSTVIARTEVVGASNAGTYEAHKISGVVDRREWVSTPDGRTRDAHRRLDGMKVGIADRFEIDGKSAPHPGAFGVAKLDIQCRCTTVAVIEDPKSDDGEARRAEIWKSYDDEIQPWEKAIREGTRRAFKAQRAAVLAALRS